MSHPIPFIFTGDHAQREIEGRERDLPAHTEIVSRPEVIYYEYILPLIRLHPLPHLLVVILNDCIICFCWFVVWSLIVKV